MKKSIDHRPRLRFAAAITLPIAGLAAALAVTVTPQPAHTAVIEESCKTPASPTEHVGTDLDTFAASKAGVVFNPAGGGSLVVAKAAGVFKNASFSVADPIEITCAADFDEDGWTDFVGATGNASAGSSTSQIKFYKNRTYESPVPVEWSDTLGTNDCSTTAMAAMTPVNLFAKCLRKPNFVATRLKNLSTTPATYKHIEETGAHVGGTMICGDFNKDNHADFIILRCNGTTENCGGASGGTGTYGTIRADIFTGLGPINKTGTADERLPRFNPKQPIFTSTQTGKTSGAIGNIRGPTVRAGVIDLNGDTKPDLVIGLSADAGGSSNARLIKAINSGGTTPHFQAVTNLIASSSLVTGVGFSAVAVGRITPGDTIPDILVGSEGSNSAWLFTDLLGGGTTANQVIAAPYGSASYSGRLSLALVHDFDMDGRLDGFAAANNNPNGAGGFSYMWKNNNSATPFTYAAPNRAAVLTTHNATTNQDYDGGFFMDYDHDPDLTTDIVVMDDDTANYRIVANTVETKYAACGSVTTDDLDVGDLSTQEASVTEVCLQPSMITPPGTSFKWEVSNDGTNFIPAPKKGTTSPPVYCANFTNSIGKKVKWRAWLYSNATQTCSGEGTSTPSITAVKTTYTYVTAQNHFRAGPVADQGLIYVGAMRQPGGAGELYALDDETLSPGDQRSWDAGALLDSLSDASRKIYVGTIDGAVLPLDLSTAVQSTGNGPLLRQTLNVGTDTTLAATLVAWMRSARFGLETYHRLGAIESSTAAVLSAPGKPFFYPRTGTTSAERTKIDAFVAEHQDRKQLVFAGSRDGMLHAFYTDPDNVTNPLRGQEAWAFVPYTVAPNLLANCVNSDSAATGKTCKSTNKGDGITQYPDGSPTLVDAKLADGEYHTVLIMGEGNGGNAVFALDVTETVRESDGVVVGPTPLWHFTATNMGRTYSKPAVVRIQKDGVERTLAIFASGSGTVSGLGDSVYALDISTGELVWELDLGTSDAYISTDVAAFETKESDGAIDGYIDRIVFADSKGRVFKIDPAAYDASGNIATIGTLDTSLVTGRRALFSTAHTPGQELSAAPVQARGISGSIGVQADSNERVVLYFGTGGTDETLDTAQNLFYAVYADDGSVKARLKPEVGVKYFGGVTVQDDQLVFSNGKNLSGTGLCAPTAGEIEVRDANTLALQFELQTSSKIVAPMYSSGGQIYTVTLKGEVVTSASAAGTGTGGGATSGSGGGNGGDGDTIESGYGKLNGNMQVLGWRQVE